MSTGQMDDVWVGRAEGLLEAALAGIRDIDVIPLVTEALAALYLSVGESPAVVVVSAADYRDTASRCTCPAELVERGGWTSRCPVHGPAEASIGQAG